MRGAGRSGCRGRRLARRPASWPSVCRGLLGPIRAPPPQIPLARSECAAGRSWQEPWKRIRSASPPAGVCPSQAHPASRQAQPPEWGVIWAPGRRPFQSPRGPRQGLLRRWRRDRSRPAGLWVVFGVGCFETHSPRVSKQLCSRPASIGLVCPGCVRTLVAGQAWLHSVGLPKRRNGRDCCRVSSGWGGQSCGHLAPCKGPASGWAAVSSHF